MTSIQARPESQDLTRGAIPIEEMFRLEREVHLALGAHGKAAVRSLVDVAETMARLRIGGDGAYENAMQLLDEELGQRGIGPSRSARLNKRKAISDGLRRRVWDRDGWKCLACNSHANLTVDHILAVSKGGTNEFDNLQTLCGSCNSSKGNR